MQYLSGVHEVVNSYDGFVVDLWGVTHDGKKPYPGVLNCLKKIKEQSKKIVFLSNAPQRAWVVKARIEEMGINHNFYDEVINSGEETHHHLKHQKDPFYQKLGRKCYHIGTEKDLSLFEDQDLEIVTGLHHADFILATDLLSPEAHPDEFKTTLLEGVRRNIPMVCANPDHIVHVGGRSQYCAGALAHLYEELGGHVKYHGKPCPSIYDYVRDHFDNQAKLLAVGDSFLTDVAGAHHAGIDVAFIGGGIHSGDLKIQYGELPVEDQMEQLCKEYNLRPNYVLPGLIW